MCLGENKMPLCGFNQTMLNALTDFSKGLLEQIVKRSRRDSIAIEKAMDIEVEELNIFLALNSEKYHDHLRSLQPGVHNIHVHIAFQTKELVNIMGLHDSSIRQIDYNVWTSDDTKNLAENLGIIFIGFRPLQQLQAKLIKN